MTIRHAAALALAGWYLMIPPAHAYSNAPLNRWEIVNSFDTAAGCQMNRSEFIQDGTRRMKANQSASDRDWGMRYEAALCISTDDPRLK
jgi:hypothetical protein